MPELGVAVQKGLAKRHKQQQETQKQELEKMQVQDFPNKENNKCKNPKTFNTCFA